MTRINISGASLGVSSATLTSAAAITAAFGQQVAANDQGKTIETVTVTDRRLTIGLLPEKLLDTPQTVNVIPTEVIKEQGVTNLQDALKNVPGITLNAGEGGTHGDLVNLRGFSAGDDYFIDGLRDTGIYNRDVFDVQSIEVYKGPASTLFGRGTTGGVINQVSKSAQLYPVDDFTLSGGNNSEIRGTGDVNYVLGDTSAVRVNVMGQRNNVVGRPFARTQKWGHRADLFLRHRHRHRILAEISASAGRRYSRLRHSLPVRRAGAGFAPRLLWSAIRRPQQGGNRCGDGQCRASPG